MNDTAKYYAIQNTDGKYYVKHGAWNRVLNRVDVIWSNNLQDAKVYKKESTAKGACTSLFKYDKFETILVECTLTPTSYTDQSGRVRESVRKAEEQRKLQEFEERRYELEYKMRELAELQSEIEQLRSSEK